MKGFTYLKWIVPIVFFGILYGDIILNANNIMFGTNDDGVKNYYTFAYYTNYEELFSSKLTGMNFPFGEHIVFTDNMPIIAIFFNVLQHIGINLGPYSVGIINILLILNLLLGSIIITAILIKLKVNKWYAMVVGILIMLMCPQLNRFFNHYALAFSAIIPLSFYFILRFIEKEYSIKLLLLFGFFVIFVSFIHPYYLLLNLILILGYIFIDFIINKKANLFNNFKVLGIGIILPIIAFNAMLKLTDPVEDRPQNPYGLNDYIVEWEGVFLPVGHKHQNWIDTNITEIRKVNWETWGYIGFPAFLISLVILISLLSYRKKLLNYLFQNKLLTIILFTGVFCLLFGIIFPWSAKIPIIRDNLGALKQFRSLGRLNWIFYFAINIFTFYSIYQIFKRRNLIINSLLTVALLFYITEIYWHQSNIIRYLKSSNIFKETQSISLSQEEYSFILPIPYFHIGSEVYYSFKAENISYPTTLAISYNNNIPTTGVMMSRTSLYQTQKQFEAISDSIMVPEIWQNVFDNKKIAVVYHTTMGFMYRTDSMVVSLSKEIATYKTCSIREISKKDLLMAAREGKMIEKVSNK